MQAYAEITTPGNDQPCDTCGDNGEETYSITLNTTTNNLELEHEYGCYNHNQKTNQEAIQYLQTQIEYNSNQQTTQELQNTLNQLLTATGRSHTPPNNNPLHININLKNNRWNPQGTNTCHCGQPTHTDINKQPYILISATKNYTTNKETITIEEYCYHQNQYNQIYTQNSLNLNQLPQPIIQNNQPYYT